MISYRHYCDYLNEFLICISGFLISFRGAFQFSYASYPLLLTGLQLISWFFVFIVLFNSFYNKLSIVKSVILLFLSLCIYLKSKSLIPFYLLLFFIASKNVDSKKVVKFYLLGNVFSTILIISFSFIGIIGNRLFDGGSSLGFTNPNTLSLHISLIILYSVYLRFSKINFLDFYLYILLAIFAGIITKSRTGLVLNFGILLLVFFVKYIPLIRRLFLKYCVLFSVLIFFLSVAGSIFVNIIPFFTKLDTLITGRFRWAQIYLGVYGLKPFGILLNDDKTRTLVLDNGYMNLLLASGFIYCFIILFLYWVTLRKARKENRIDICIFVFSVLVGMFTESHFNVIAENCSLIVCAEYFFAKKEKYCDKSITNSLVFE